MKKKSLEHVIKSWYDFFTKESIIHEFVICEDGSTDGTKELVQHLKQKYQFQINHQK